MDTRSEIFQNLNGASQEISILADEHDLVIYNNVTQTIPAVIHGNGGSKVIQFFFI